MPPRHKGPGPRHGPKHGPRPARLPEHEHRRPRPHDEPEHELPFSLEDLETGSQIFVTARGQNIELIKLAAQLAGYGPGGATITPENASEALQHIYDMFHEFVDWIDPELDDDDEE